MSRNRFPDRPAPALPTAVATLCAVLFIGVAMGVSHGWTMPFDLLMRAEIHRWSSPAATQTAVLLSFVGSTAVLLVLTASGVAWLFWTGRTRAGALLGASIAGAIVLDNALKYAFQRPRPVPFFGTNPESFSFPSGHALYASCFFSAVVVTLFADLRNPYGRALFVTCAVLLVAGIGASRIYLGVHYPTDVAAGYLTGTGWTCIAAVATRAIPDRK